MKLRGPRVRYIIFSMLITLPFTAASGVSSDDTASLAGSSFFELLNQSSGKLPESFGEIRKLMSADYPLAIPDGRSLQKKKADFKDPRIVIAQGRKIFVGYASKVKQAEVISWNQKEGRFDFFLIKNFGKGLTPEISVPERGVCTVCHQAGGPIYSRGPWDESTIMGPFTNPETHLPELNEDGSVFQGNELYQKLIAANGGSRDFDGVDVSAISVTMPSSFDGSVRDANHLAQSYRACREMCGANVECRTQLIQDTFLHPSEAEVTALQKSLEKNWPSDGFAYPSSVIPNRDPTDHPEQGGTATRIFVTNPDKLKKLDRTIVTMTIGFGNPDGTSGSRKETGLANGDPNVPNSLAHIMEDATAKGIRTAKGIEVTYDERSSTVGAGFPIGGCTDCPNEDGVVKFERFPATDGSLADPLVARPKVNGIPVNEAAKYAAAEAFDCLGFTDSDRALLAGYSGDALHAVLLSSDVQTLLKAWPVDRAALMIALLRGLGALQKAACYVSLAPLPAVLEAQLRKVESATRAATPAEKPKTYLMQKYCSKCHATDDIVRLPLENLQKLRGYVGDTGATVLKKLSTGRMPPRSEFLQPTAEERTEMLRLLNSRE